MAWKKALKLREQHLHLQVVIDVENVILRPCFDSPIV
jgi:hypothetical protein